MALPNPNSVETNKSAVLFVGNELPFVGRSKWQEIPFVGQNTPNIPKQHGFTLIELIVTMAIAAILILAVVPNMQSIFQSTRIVTQANDLIAEAQLARTEAIKRSKVVVLCASANGNTCGADWNAGRLMFVDLAPNNFEHDPAEEIIRIHDALPPGSVQAVLSPNFPGKLIYSNQGYLLNTLGLRLSDTIPDMPVSIGVCDVENKVRPRMVSFGITGQATSATMTLSCP